MANPIIYHGTPMTPRAALLDVCAGRAICVSFYRPDDVEAVEAISPAIMFRQRRVLVLEGGATRRAGMGRNTAGLDAIFRVAGTALVSSWPVGSDPRHSGCAQPAQRCTSERLAVWAEGCAAVAHGRANRTAPASLRQIRPSVFGLDGRRKDSRQPRISRQNGRGQQGVGKQLARNSHDARDTSGF